MEDIEQAVVETDGQATGPSLRIIPLGGLGEIGLNMTVFEYGDSIIVVDCGLMFPEDHMLGIDIVIPDISYLRRNSGKVKAFFITHGHEDHTGALPFVLREINAPIYATTLTLGLIEEKLREFDLVGSTVFETVRPREVVSVGPFSVEFIRVSHSIADACALAITTPRGIVVHTGDFKIDQTPVDGDVLDYARFAEYGEKGVMLLMSDSTNVEREGYTLSEREIGRNLEEILRDCGGRIIVAGFSSNIHRLHHSCLRIFHQPPCACIRPSIALRAAWRMSFPPPSCGASGAPNDMRTSEGFMEYPPRFIISMVP